LDKADEIIRKRKEAIALTEQLQKSIFLDMFGDPVINPKGWEVVQLSKIADFENGDRSSNYPSGKDIIENGILFLNTKNIVNNQLNLGIKQYISEEKFNSLTRGKLKKGDLLITLRGTLGNCCIFESEYRTGFINAQMMIIRVKPNISNKFIHALLTSKQLNNFLQMIGNGAAIPQLTAKQIKELGVYNPPIELQNKFSDFIEKITKLKEKHYQNLQESENLFNSLLQKAFKGEL
jgi:type I restriction enzyme S subunit